MRFGNTNHIKSKKAMGKLLKLWELIKRHKYLIVLGVFTIHITFFDENNLITRLENKMTISELSKEVEAYRTEYDRSTKMLNSIKKDPASIEKIAREKYLMKKDNEDIYLIEKK